MSKKPEGLGDVIANVTHATKLDKLAEKVAHMAGKEDCGCKKRQQKLNQMFPFNGSETESKTKPGDQNS